MDIVILVCTGVVVWLLLISDWSWSIGIRTSARYYGVGMSKSGAHLELKVGGAA